MPQMRSKSNDLLPAAPPQPRPPQLVDVVLQIQRVKWINAATIVVEGITTPTAEPVASDKGEICFLTIQQEKEDVDKGPLHNLLKALTALNLTVSIQPPSTERVKQQRQTTGRWTQLQLSDNDDPKDAKSARIFISVQCPSSTNRNRKGARLLDCTTFVTLWIAKLNPGEKTAAARDRGSSHTVHRYTRKNREDTHNNLSFGLSPKTARHELFANWIMDTYGQRKAILDVAGGNGALSRALLQKNVTQHVVLLDPNPRLSHQKEDSNTEEDIDKKITIIRRPLIGKGSELLNDVAFGPLIRECSLIVGMHPDQATEAMMDLAAHLNKGVPVALLPCCVMPKLFPHRRQHNSGDPVRSYSTFCQYLLQKGSDDNYRETSLPFDGRNKIIYCLDTMATAKVTLPQYHPTREVAAFSKARKRCKTHSGSQHGTLASLTVLMLVFLTSLSIAVTGRPIHVLWGRHHPNRWGWIVRGGHDTLLSLDDVSESTNQTGVLDNNTVDLLNTTAKMVNTEETPPQLPKWKAALPTLLQRKGNRTLQRLLLGNVEVYLLGTAHVSKDSCQDVEFLLESVSPSCIFVELCDARIPLLDGSDDDSVPLPPDEAVPPKSEPDKNLSWGQRVARIQESQGGSKWQAMCTLLLTSVQEDYAETLGVELGGEFRAAHKYWLSRRTVELQRMYPSSFPALILGDRPLSLTLVRAWESLRWWPKVKVLLGLLWSSFRKPNKEEVRAWLESVLREESDILTESLAELRKHFPSLYATIIAERDAWLACKLVQTCRILHTTGDSTNRAKVVAIVGAGHVPGIVDLLTSSKPNQTVEQHLLELSQTKRWQNDALVQTQMIPQWVHDVTQIQDPTTISQ